MSAIFLLLGLLAGGAVATWFVSSSEHTHYTSRVKDLESKLRYAQGETVNLKEQLTSVRAQVLVTEKTLMEERLNHTTALSAMTVSFKKGILALTTAYFTVGLVFGGSAGWFGASWRVGGNQAGEKSRLEMGARLAELKSDLLQRQLDQLKESSTFFERALREERVARAVALTKLQILLESVIPQKSGEGFSLDEQRLKKNLKDKIEVESAYPEMPVLHSSLRP